MSGRRLIELDGGAPASWDTCWWSDSNIDQQHTLSGGTWFVGDDNTWGVGPGVCCDSVGWPDAARKTRSATIDRTAVRRVERR